MIRNMGWFVGASEPPSWNAEYFIDSLCSSSASSTPGLAFLSKTPAFYSKKKKKLSSSYFMDSKRVRRPWDTDHAKESVAQILGALAFGGKPAAQEDVTMSSTHEEEEDREAISEFNGSSMNVDHEASTSTTPKQQEGTMNGILEDKVDESNHVFRDDNDEDDDDDVNSIQEEDEEEAFASQQNLEPSAPPLSPSSSDDSTNPKVSTSSPVREIVRDYESGRNLSTTISPRVEELLAMIPDGLVKEKIDTVEFTKQMMFFKRVVADCATAANRRNEARRANRPMSIMAATSTVVAEAEEIRKNKLQAEMEEGRRRAAQAMQRLQDPGLSLPEFDDEDVKSMDSVLDTSKAVLSVSTGGIDEEEDDDDDDMVEEVIGEDEFEETIIEERVEEPSQEESSEEFQPVEVPPVHTLEEHSVDLEEIRRQKMKAEMEEGRRRAAAALAKKEHEDGLTIETVASTTKTSFVSPDLVLLESKSDDSDKPTPRSIPAEITDETRAFDQFSESDVLSSAMSSMNETESLQHSSPRKRVAEIIRRDLWDKDVIVVESALKLLVDKLMHSTDVITFRNAIARNGGILAIVRAMEQHVEHGGIQIAACRALEQLALETENELAIGEVGGVEAILGAMMTHFTQTDVQDAAWSALCNCTCGNACDIMTIDTQGGMTAIVSCMKQHIDHASIQSSAVGTLTNLCWNNEGRMAELVKAGGFSVMAKTLQTHWDNLTVRNETAHAMHVLLGGAAWAHQELQGEPDVIDELVLAECDTDEELDEGEYTDEEVPE